MKIYFVRHGETQYNKDGMLTGQTDISITEEGIEQARGAVNNLPQDCTEIYCSDLLRCKQTAEFLNETINLPITYDERFRERNWGELQGKFFHEVHDTLTHYNKNTSQIPPGGESFENIKNRLLSAIEDIKKNRKGDKVVVVTHGGVIRLLHDVLKGKIPETIHNSSVHEFEFPDEN